MSSSPKIGEARGNKGDEDAWSDPMLLLGTTCMRTADDCTGTAPAPNKDEESGEDDGGEEDGEAPCGEKSGGGIGGGGGGGGGIRAK